MTITTVQVQTVATSPVTLSGEQTINGIVLVDGNNVLLIAQADTLENDVWIVRTGAWERNAATLVSGAIVMVLHGGVYILMNTGTIIKGTTVLTFDELNNTKVQNILAEIIATGIPGMVYLVHSGDSYTIPDGVVMQYSTVTKTDGNLTIDGIVSAK
jgi:hypothetical protein